MGKQVQGKASQSSQSSQGDLAGPGESTTHDRRRPAGAALLLLAAGLAIGFAVAMNILGWHAAVSGPHIGACHARGPKSGCALSPGFPSIFFLAIGPFFVIGALLSAAVKWWPTSLRKRLPFAILAAGAVIGMLPGVFVYHWRRTGEASLSIGGLHVPHVRWAAAPDRPSTVSAVGAWADGQTVVRVRTDAAIAYAAGDGHVEWTFPIPGQDTVCAVSRTVSEHIGLVAYRADGQPCTEVAGIDLQTGRQLWTVDRGASAFSDLLTTYSDDIAVAGDAAFLREDHGIRAVSLRDGTPRWRSTATDSCAEDAVAADASLVLTIEGCGSGGETVALDAGTGAVRWEAKLSVPGTLNAREVLSVDPAVVHVSDQASRPVDLVVSYDAQGRQRTAIPTAQPDEDIVVVEPTAAQLQNAPAPRAVVTDGLLITPVTLAGGNDRMAAFSLADGHHVWQNAADSEDGQWTSSNPVAMDLQPDGLYVATPGWDRPRIVRLDPGTGRVTMAYVISGDNRFGWGGGGLFVVDGDYVQVAVDGTGDDHRPIAMWR
ncbi:outer membrane protein assembly factor BamB [Catenulispora sp. MAP12-49]|uniref:outer membrane protein assembly factor BamB family protein n=1 Tax=Catenulispora sp. MAP12-49 TaxID=3156302 RepID=UPI00351819D4